MTALSIVGSSRKNGDREENDFYPTPPYAVNALLVEEKFTGSVFEPACGDGAISKVLIANNLNVFSSDLIYREYGAGGHNFLEYKGEKFDNIITNPPYKYALEFVNQSKKYANKKIAMFLKTVFLEGDKRYKMFHDTEFPLKCMYQFSKRVSLYKNGEKMKNSGMISFAWFVWDKDYVGKPMINWINTKESE